MSRRAREVGGALAAYIVSLSVALIALSIVLPTRGSETMRMKLDHFRRNKDAFDTLVIGPSTMHHGLDPVQFDESNAEAGVPTRTFNLAVSGTTLLAHEYVLREVLALEPAELRWVLVQSEGVHEASLSQLPSLEPQSIAWHDLRGTLDACALLLEQDPDNLVQALGAQWVAWAHRTLEVSRARPWVERLLGVEPTEEDGVPLTLGERGFVFLSAAVSPRLAERQERFRYTEPLWERELRAALRGEVDRAPVPPVLPDLVERFEALGRERGIGTIFLTIAGAARGSPAIVAGDEGRVEHVLRYDDVARYPNFFHPRNRFDRSHFNRRGAKIFTDQVARDFRHVVQGRH